MDVAQGGMAGPKVIDCNMNSVLRERVKRPSTTFKIAHDRGFCDFNVQPSGGQMAFG
jgi:hypothetical protein